MPEPYIPKQPNDLIRAADWNAIQVSARTDLESHDHGGGAKGAPIGSAGIVNGAITTAKLADAAVGTTKLADGAVTGAKLANGTITQAKLDPNIQLNQNLMMLLPAGGDGQVGRPGETLPIALRVRISDGKLPLANQHVEFLVLDTMLGGASLDEYRGGSLHASVTGSLVSAQVWTNGTRAKQVVVKTDAQGIAQVQWLLGTEVGLPIQRVQAFLLDAQGNRTSQQTLFTGHLLIATEVGWFVHPALVPFLPNPSNNVQAALDGLANAMSRLGIGIGDVSAFLLDGGNNKSAAIGAGMVCNVNSFNGVVIDNIPTFGNMAEWMVKAAITVGIDVPSAPYFDRISSTQLVGGVQWTANRITWSITTQSRTFAHDAIYPITGRAVRMTIDFTPSAVGLAGAPQRWVVLLRIPNLLDNPLDPNLDTLEPFESKLGSNLLDSKLGPNLGG